MTSIEPVLASTKGVTRARPWGYAISSWFIGPYPLRADIAITVTEPDCDASEIEGAARAARLRANPIWSAALILVISYALNLLFTHTHPSWDWLSVIVFSLILGVILTRASLSAVGHAFAAPLGVRARKIRYLPRSTRLTRPPDLLQAVRYLDLLYVLRDCGAASDADCGRAHRDLWAFLSRGRAARNAAGGIEPVLRDMSESITRAEGRLQAGDHGLRSLIAAVGVTK